MEMEIENWTPHPVVCIAPDGSETVFHPVGNLRVPEETEVIGELNGIPLSRVRYASVELPPKQEGKFLIVSRAVLTALGQPRPGEPRESRDDLVMPYGPVLEDKEGGGKKVVGVRGFARFK